MSPRSPPLAARSRWCAPATGSTWTPPGDASTWRSATPSSRSAGGRGPRESPMTCVAIAGCTYGRSCRPTAVATWTSSSGDQGRSGPASPTLDRARRGVLRAGSMVQAQLRLGHQPLHRLTRTVRVARDDRFEDLSMRADAVLEEVRPLPTVAGRDAQAGLKRGPERCHELDEVIVVGRGDEHGVVADVRLQVGRLVRGPRHGLERDLDRGELVRTGSLRGKARGRRLDDLAHLEHAPQELRFEPVVHEPGEHVGVEE